MADSPFTLHRDQFIGEPIVGFGAQMNPYLYSAPNWGDVTEENVKDLEQKIIDLAPQHVRIFFLNKWWDGRGDVISGEDNSVRESFLRTAHLAQRAGATINLTHWYENFPDSEQAAQRFAQILKELLDEHQLHAIQYVTLQNEPNLGQRKFTMDDYNVLYRAFDAALRAEGIRDRIKIIGGDLVQDNQQAWFANLAEHQHDILDGYAVHMYWDYWDTAKLLRRVSEVPPIVQSLPPEAQKPLYITEFGVRGHRDIPRNEPGVYEDGRVISDVPLQAMQIAWFMLEAINRGYLATVQWDMYTVWYDRYMPFGTIGGVKDGWPLRPAYHVLHLFTHTAQPGWRAVKVDGTDDAAIAAALRSPDGEMSCYILNRSTALRAVRLQGLPPGRPLQLIRWNAAGDGTLAAPAPITADDTGALTIELHPMSLIALTTAAAPPTPAH